jgi:hypothetical protein
MGKIRGPNPCFRQTILPKNNEPNFRFSRLGGVAVAAVATALVHLLYREGTRVDRAVTALL